MTTLCDNEFVKYAGNVPMLQNRQQVLDVFKLHPTLIGYSTFQPPKAKKLLTDALLTLLPNGHTTGPTCY